VAVDKRLNLSLMPLFFLFICLLFLALDDAVDDDDDDDNASSPHLLVLTVLFNPIIKRAEKRRAEQRS